MLLRAFRIQNYKSFLDSGKCSVENGVTILAGQNESGKTNVLSALVKINEQTPTFTADEYSFNHDSVSPEVTYWFDFSDSDIAAFNNVIPDVTFTEKTIEISVTEKNRRCKTKWTYAGSLEENIIEQKVMEQLGKMFPKFVLYETITDDIPNSFVSADITKAPIKRLSTYLNADFSKIFTNKNQQQQKNATQKLSRKISEDFSKKYKQKSVHLEFDINSSTISIYVRDKKPDADDYGYSFQLAQRSTGLRWYLNFYIALKGEQLSPGDVILVDEPGLYLHPKAQQEMRDILNEESQSNQIIYTTHSPYLIDADNLNQIRLVEKKGIEDEDGYNEASEIKERIHHGKNIDTIKPIIDAIGYSLGSELNLQHKKVLICEGVSDYCYIKALEHICGKELGFGITHANGCDNIARVNSLFLGLGVSEVYALLDSDDGGIRARSKLLKCGVFDEDHIVTTHTTENVGKAIEDIFDRAWFLKEIMEYDEDKIDRAEQVLSKEIKKNRGGAKYVVAKKCFDIIRANNLQGDVVLNQEGTALLAKLLKIAGDNKNES